MLSVYVKKARIAVPGLFALLILFAGTAASAAPAVLEPGQQEVVLKIENMT